MYVLRVLSSAKIHMLVSVLVALAASHTSITRAQCEANWTQRQDVPQARQRHVMVFDAARGVAVLYGGRSNGGSMLDVWEWNGRRWSQPQLVGDPPPRFIDWAGAYDSRRAVMVTQGRTGGNEPQPETWEWDGRRWRLRAVTGPNFSSFYMAYDSARGVTVLVGGNSGESSETWEWDGSRWEMSTSDTPVNGVAIVYDSARRESVLFVHAGSESETWVWDGERWDLRATGGPTPVAGPGFAYDSDRQVAILFGGGKGGSKAPVPDTWEWDGQVWTLRDNKGPSRWKHAMVYDSVRHEVLLFGGVDLRSFPLDLPATGDTWSWNGESWKLRDLGDPPWRALHDMAYDSRREKIVMFGGRNLRNLCDTWEHDGAHWRFVAPDGPPARQGHSMAFDSRRSVTVLYGGKDRHGEPLGDTWEWDGKEWILRDDGQNGPLNDGPMVYDAGRGVMVIYVKSKDQGSVGATWEWDGETWTLRASGSPPFRTQHGLAYDRARGVTVLFGGRANDGTFLQDTWEWDGAEWSLRAAAGPGPRRGPSMAYDPLRRVTVMSAGFALRRRDEDTWKWDGVKWRRTGDGPPRRAGAPMVYAAGRHIMVVYAGQSELGDTWEMRSATAPGDVNCDGSVDLLDVEPFIDALFGREVCDECAADTNSDGSVDLQDVESFIEILIG